MAKGFFHGHTIYFHGFSSGVQDASKATSYYWKAIAFSRRQFSLSRATKFYSRLAPGRTDRWLAYRRKDIKQYRITSLRT